MSLGAVASALEALKPLAKFVPVAGAGLEGAIEVSVIICRRAEKAKTNKDAVVELAQKQAAVATAVAAALKSRTLDEAERRQWAARVDALRLVLDNVKAFVDAQQNTVRAGKVSKFFRGFLAVEMEADKIEKLNDQLDAAITESQLIMDLETTNVIQTIKSLVEAIQTTTRISERMHEEALLKERLQPVFEARLGAIGSPGGCFPDTRVALLERLLASLAADHGPRVVWLSGLAGTGKTAVARSMCQLLDQQRIYAVSFCIKREIADWKCPVKILHTVVYSLAQHFPGVRSAVLDAGEHVFKDPIHEQIQRLVWAPLSSSPGMDCVIVIDAFDECDEAEIGDCDLLSCLISAVDASTAPVRLLITSRNEPTELKACGVDEALAAPRPTHLKLQDSDPTLDIEHYLAVSFQRIVQRHSHSHAPLSTDWPTDSQLKELVRKAGGLFLYAATIIRFVDDPNDPLGSPESKLAAILSESSAPSGAYDGLYALYDHLLDKALKSSVYSKELRCIIGALVLLQDQLTIMAVDELLTASLSEIQRREFSRLLAAVVPRLSAVLTQEQHGALAIYHASFHDFLLLSKSRFRINAGDVHADLALKCLALMNARLKRDICGIYDPSLANADVPNLQHKLDNFIPAALRYACQHWAAHFALATWPDAQGGQHIRKELGVFCGTHLLHWIETLSLLGRMNAGLTGLHSVTRTLTENGSSSVAVQLLTDAERLMNDFYAPIALSALHTYYTAVAFMPKTLLFDRVGSGVSNTLHLRSKRPSTWAPLRRIISGNCGAIYSVSFSPDNAHIVSGSFDNTVRIWEAATGDSVAVLAGHSSSVMWATFSPDGQRILSSSADCTVKVWSAREYSLVATLLGHSLTVNCVTASYDSMLIISAADDRTVRIWSAEAHRLIATLEGHSEKVNCVSVSPTGPLIISGSDDSSVCVWNMSTNELIARLDVQKPVSSVSFSPDGSQFLTGSGDEILLLWRTKTLRRNRLLATLAMQRSRLRAGMYRFKALSFSPDGSRIYAATEQNNVAAWDTATGDREVTLPGHTDVMSSLSCSSDGLYIASGSHDGTIRILDRKLVEPSSSNATRADTSHDMPGTRDTTPGPVRSTTSVQKTFVFDRPSGWIMCKRAGDRHDRRVFWIPEDSRPSHDAIWPTSPLHAITDVGGLDNGDLVAFESQKGGLIILDVAYILAAFT